jgi:hypothetical protein
MGIREINLNSLCILIPAADMITGCVMFNSLSLITGVHGSDSGHSLRTSANELSTQNYTETDLYNGHTPAL